MARSRLAVPFALGQHEARRNFDALTTRANKVLEEVRQLASYGDIARGLGWAAVRPAPDQDEDGKPEAYAFWLALAPMDGASFGIAYHDVVYSIDAGEEPVMIHALRKGDGPDLFLAELDQPGFDVDVVLFSGPGGQGEPLGMRTIPTGRPMDHLSGVVVAAKNGQLIPGLALGATAPFDFAVSQTDRTPQLRLRAQYEAGTVSGQWQPDYLNGPVQHAVLGGDTTVMAVANMPAGGTFNLLVRRNGYYLGLDTDVYEGMLLAVSGTSGDRVAMSMVDFGTGKIVVGVMVYDA